MNNQYVVPLREFKPIIELCLSECRTIGSKKRFLTNDIKHQQSFVNDIEEALQHDGWLHGNRWNEAMLINEVNILEYLIHLRKTIK